MTQTKTDTTANEKASIMERLLKLAPEVQIPKAGSLVDGKVINIYKNRILVDINGVNTGIIAGREVRDAVDTLKSLKVDDAVSAYVIEEENDEGYTVLSLRKASQEKTWKRFEEAFAKGTMLAVQAREANKGGLLLEIDGIKGFIPVSQLAPMHYPRVNGADTNMILQRLKALIGLKFNVKIINIDKENGKLILSEKAAMEEQRKKALQDLKIGDKVHGHISGIVKFGIFVAFDSLEGLVHISEIAWGHVKDPANHGKLGDEVDVMVIGVDGEKISLSMKRLQEDPWVVAAKNFKIDDIVEGEINRLTPFGAFMKMEEDLNGLIHLSEIPGENIKDPAEALKIGDKVKAKIIAIEPSEHRIGLSIKAVETAGKPAKKKIKSAEKETGKEAEKAQKKPVKTPAEEDIEVKVKKTVKRKKKSGSDEKTEKSTRKEKKSEKEN